VGLGNPGPEYERTRHNAGFVLADRLASRWQLGQYRRVDRAREARGTWQGTPVAVLKPQTYMNRSGAAVGPLRNLPEKLGKHEIN
jgi:PTH1 family peptidyl-tRNA hydrolase